MFSKEKKKNFQQMIASAVTFDLSVEYFFFFPCFFYLSIGLSVLSVDHLDCFLDLLPLLSYSPNGRTAQQMISASLVKVVEGREKKENKRSFN